MGQFAANSSDDFVLEFSAFSDEMRSLREALKLKSVSQTSKTKVEMKGYNQMNADLDTSVRRPILSPVCAQKSAHEAAFNAYVRRGDESDLRHIEIESKGMRTDSGVDGGYLVDPITTATIQSALRGASSLRAVANVVKVEASAYDVLVDHSSPSSGWISENQEIAESAGAKIDRISVELHELAAMPKASQRLLDDSAFNVETWLGGKIADSFARSESSSFIYGDGNGKPKGVMVNGLVPNEEWEWGSLGFVTSGADGDFDPSKPADAIVTLVYALPSQYRQNATFVMNSKTAGAIRKMKDADGRFLWNDSLAISEPARLMGYPVLICEEMPDIASGAPAVFFGDFSKGYTIAERPEMRILRDPFSAKPHVLFYATKRVGGSVTDFAAIKVLVFTAS